MTKWQVFAFKVPKKYCYKIVSLKMVNLNRHWHATITDKEVWPYLHDSSFVRKTFFDVEVLSWMLIDRLAHYFVHFFSIKNMLSVFVRLHNLPNHVEKTGMHSSRMCTIRCSVVSGGGSAQGKCLPTGSVCPQGCLLTGVSARRCLPRGCTPPPVNRITDRCKNHNYCWGR